MASGELTIPTSHTYPASVRGLIIPAQSIDQQPFIDIVDEILFLTEDVNYLDNPKKKKTVRQLEKQIDQLVYKIYNLIPEEIEIIDDFVNERKGA